MEREIKKFDSFEEQEKWQLEHSAKLTPVENLIRLRDIQRISKLHKHNLPTTNRKIIKKDGFI